MASSQAGAAKLMVKVSLLPDLRGRLTAQDSLFVYAQAPQGPPMPLAVVRKPASELPLTVQLDDSQAMLPNHRLSNYDQVMITARISHSGQATPQPGDLIGRVGPLETRRTAPSELVIGSVSR
jgi:cytochrome c-type biogenesis protein CcmH